MMFKAFSISRSLYYAFMVLFYAFCVCYFATVFLVPFTLALCPIVAYFAGYGVKSLLFFTATAPIGFLVANVLWNADIIFKPFEIFDRFYYNEKIKGWEY